MLHFASKAAFLLALCSLTRVRADDIEYGPDVSWPMHETRVSTNYPWLAWNVDPSVETPEEYVDMPVQPLGDVQSRYNAFIQGCVNYYEQHNNTGNLCYQWEEERIERINDQPDSMLYFTEDAFGLAKVPDHVFASLKQFWETNQGQLTQEVWESGDSHSNHWESPTYLLSLGNTELPGGGFALEQQVLNEVRAIIEEWTGQRLVDASVYGIRVYTSGAILAPHLEANPYITSAIINVAQEVEEPWPFEVIDHNGVAHNVTLNAGEMVVYESHSVIHGHPFPLKGRFMANIFIHFEPIGPLDEPIDFEREIPPYVDPESEDAEGFVEEHPEGYLDELLSTTHEETPAHYYAAHGDVEGLTSVLQEAETCIFDLDENNWTPLARAVRNGHEQAVRLLLSKGADPNALLGVRGDGGSILWVARQELGDEHPVVKLLEDLGAREVEPLEERDEEEEEEEGDEDEEEGEEEDEL